MKKILVLFLVLFLPLAAFAQEPLSQEVLDQAKLQAGLFLELKNALGLAWMDDYNAYLEDPVNSPQPAWASSVQDLINDNYLSGTFPTDFVITPTGQEVTISRTITSQAIKDVLPIYLPSVAISGDTVSLLVQRPEQWVAWQAGLLGKVSRDGSDDPDILPNSVLDFGEGSEIRFVNNDGKISGVESLTYKGDELDDRFVNTSGDNMTGDLKINGYKVLHTGDYGHGNGINADLLDGQHGSFYQNASNLSAGIVPPDRLKGQTYEIDILGNAATASKLSEARKISLTGNASGSVSFDGSDDVSIDVAVHNSDNLDGHDASYFVAKHGDTMEGTLVLPNLEVQSGGTIRFKSLKSKEESEKELATIFADQSGNLNLQANKVTVPSKMDVGGLKITDIYAQDVFGWKSSIDLSGSNVGIRVPDQNILLGFNDKGGITVVDTTNGAPLFELDRKGQLYVNRNKVWHAGNDGSGSGLDADLLDGFDSSAFVRQVEIPAGADLNDYTSVGFYRNALVVNARTMKNIPHPEAFYMVVLGGGTCVQIFFPYNINKSTRKFYIRYYYGYINYWSPWSYVNLDGEQPTYNPGTRAYIDLADNPIDVSEFLSKPALISFSEVTDETGTYKMWKYKRSVSRLPNYNLNQYILNQKLNLIKQKTGFAVVDDIWLSIEAYPKTEGNILAAGACRMFLAPYVAVRDRYAGKDLYDSIVSAKDIVGKSQGPCKQESLGDTGLFEVYTMKSSYQYGNVYIEAESEGKLLITGVWGQY